MSSSIGACADRDLAFDGVGLALLVERHHDHRRAVVAAHPGLGEELARSPSLIEIELTTGLPCTHSSPASITSNFDESIITGHAGDVGLGGDQVEERHHRLTRVEQTLVHVDVDHLGAVLDLVAGDVERLGEVAVLDQPAELGRAGDVGALADVDEGDVVGERERLEPRELQRASPLGRSPGGLAGDGVDDRGDVVGRGAAAAADDVDEPGLGELAEDRRRLCRASRRSSRARSAGRRSGRRTPACRPALDSSSM